MRRLLRTFAAATVVALVVPLGGLVSTTATARDSTSSRLASQRQIALATPGDFTGYGFDQCLAPTQSAMDTWWKKSPFSAVGIYISGDSRACRSQPNLSPTWVATQVARGWRLLPIALGPQASCQPRFPRYADDFKISPKPAGGYATGSGPGVGRGRQERRRRDGVRHRRGQHDLVRPRGLQPRRHPLPRVGPGLREQLGDADQGARLRGRLLLQRQLRHQDAGRRAHPAPRPVRPARPHLDRTLGRRGQHLDDLHPRGRVASGRSDEAVPRRAQRDVGRRHDQHRQQLHRPRRRLQRRTRGSLPRHPARLLEVPHPLPRRRQAHAGQGPPVPADRAGHLLRCDRRRLRRGDHRRGARLAGMHASSPRPTRSRSATGPPSSPPADVRRSSAAPPTSRSTGSSGR